MDDRCQVTVETAVILKGHGGTRDMAALKRSSVEAAFNRRSPFSTVTERRGMRTFRRTAVAAPRLVAR